MTIAGTFNRAKLMITFARIAASGSISAAAEQMRLDKGAVSRQLRELEEMFNAQLMHRSARGVVLTEVGSLVYEHAQRVIQELKNAELDAQALRSKPCGVLTVSASVAFGKLHVVPVLSDFIQCFPDIDIQLCLLDRHADMIEEGMDVLLRLCDTPPENLVAHHLCGIDYVVVASPDLLGDEATIESPDDLLMRNCLFYGFKNRNSIWRFTRAGLTQDVPVTTRISVNSSESVRDLALQGLGIAMLPRFAVAADLRTGRLRRLLPDYVIKGALGGHLYALHLPGRAMSPKIRSFIDFIRDRWSGDDDLLWR